MFEPAKLFPEHNGISKHWDMLNQRDLAHGLDHRAPEQLIWQYPHTGVDLLLVELCFTLPIANVRAGADFSSDSQLWGHILPFFSLWELTPSGIVSNNMLVLESYKISNIWLKKVAATEYPREKEA